MDLSGGEVDVGVVKELLRGVMLNPVRLESNIVEEIEKVFRENGIRYQREAKIAPRCRVDLLVDGGIAVEVKKGKPNVKSVMAQVERYALSDMVTALVLVSERGLWGHITESNGKAVEYIALSENWGLTV